MQYVHKKLDTKKNCIKVKYTLKRKTDYTKNVYLAIRNCKHLFRWLNIELVKKKK